MITTIIPTYRRPHLLKRAINSVLKQTYSDVQVCVYDNASGDETEEVVRGLMREDSRIKYHCHKENIGIMTNYEYALSKIDTDYFSILSDDDFLLPSFFETALKGFERFPDAAFSACATKLVNENGRVLGIPINNWKKDGYFTSQEGLIEMIEHPLFPTGIVFNRNLVKDVQVDFSEEMFVRWDTTYLLQIISRFPFVTNKRICSVFLVHPEGFSTDFFLKMRTNSLLLNDYLSATKKMMSELIPALEQFPKEKKRIRTALERSWIQELTNVLLSYPVAVHQKELISFFWKAISVYRKENRVDLFIVQSILKVMVFKYTPRVFSSMRLFLELYSKTLNRPKVKYLRGILSSK